MPIRKLFLVRGYFQKENELNFGMWKCVPATSRGKSVVAAEIPNMKAIFKQVTEKSVKICWNCNDQDLLAPGLKSNFRSIKKWFGDTVHIRELNVGDYPYQQLMSLFLKMKYNGWILLEARTAPADRIAAMNEQWDIFNKMINKT